MMSQEQGKASQDRKIVHIRDLLDACHWNVEKSLALDVKFLMRSLNPAAGLRIGLSSKSVEKCFLEHLDENYNDQDKHVLLGDYEANVFGYAIGASKKSSKSIKGGKSNGFTYNVPLKAMVGRAMKTPQEAIDHFKK